MDCAALIFFHCVLLIRDTHATLAYIRIGVTYIFTRFMRVIVGIGLFRFGMGKCMTRVLNVFLIILLMFCSKFNVRPNVAHRYLTRIPQGMNEPFRVTVAVLVEYIVKHHFLRITT